MWYTFWCSVLFVSVVGVLYPIIIYPLILQVMVSRKRKTKGEVANVALSPFSLIIPAHNEEKVIEKKIRNILECAAETGVTYQIIVAADGCTDRTCDIVERFAGQVELVRVKNRAGILGAFKAGLELCKHEIVFFSDADIQLDRSALRFILRNFADPVVGGACGSTSMMIQPHSGLNAEMLNVHYRRWIRMNQSRAHSSIGADGATWAVRKNLLRFSTERPPLAEDLVIPLEILEQGYRYVYEPDARAQETSPQCTGDEFHRKVRTIAGGIQTAFICNWMFTRKHWVTAFHYLSFKIAKYAISFWLIVGLVAVCMLRNEGVLWGQLCVAAVCAVGIALLGGVIRSQAPRLTPRTLSSLWYALLVTLTPVFAIGYLRRDLKKGVLWRMAAR